MQNPKTVDRRQFMKTVLIATGAVAVTGALGVKSAQWAFSDPVQPLNPLTIDKGSSMSKILVAYATKCGSTAEIASAVGDSLVKAGHYVTISPVQKVEEISSYSNIVLGTALRFEKPLDEMMNFVNHFQAELQFKSVACFTAGAYMREDTPENREKTMGFLTQFLKLIPTPIKIGLFGGKVDYATIAPFWRFLVSMDKSGLMSEGDGRDWNKIKQWSEELAASF